MKNTAAVIIVIMIIFSGCANRAYRDFDIRFENNYSKEIKRIEMHSEQGAYVRREFLSSGVSSVIGLGLTYPANDVYEIKWQYSDEEIYSKTFDLRNILPENFKGDLVFSVTENNELIFYQWISPFQYDYSVNLLNRSRSILYKPSISSSKGVIHITEYLKDKLLKGDEIRIRHRRKFPANGVYKIKWLSGTGEKFEKKVDLSQIIDMDFEGVVQFTINEDNEVGYSCK